MTEAELAWRPRYSPWFVGIFVTLAAAMELLDTTIVNVALPHISGSLSAGADESSWTLTSYLVSNSIVVPMAGFFSRLIGRRRFFILCVASFTICSLLCGLATSLPQLIVFRLLQGFFGGGLQPSQQAILMDTFPPQQRGRAFSMVAIAAMVSPLLGPSLGGYLTEWYDWRWVFLINVPIGIILVPALLVLVEDPPWVRRTQGLELDYPGMLLIAVGFGCVQIALDRGEYDDWLNSDFIRMMLGVGIGSLVAAVFWLIYAEKPIIDLSVFLNRNFAIGFVLIGGVGWMIYSNSVLLSQLVQLQFGYTSLWAGYVLMPGTFGTILFVVVVGRLLPFVQTRLIPIVGLGLVAISYLWIASITPDFNFLRFMSVRAVMASGLAFLFLPLNVLSFRTMPRRLTGDAASLFAMARNLAGSLAISITLSMVTTGSQAHMDRLVGDTARLDQNYADASSQVRQTLSDAGVSEGTLGVVADGRIWQSMISQASLLAYRDVFYFNALAALLLCPLCFLFPPTRGAAAQPVLE